MEELLAAQERVARRFGATFLPTPAQGKLGVALQTLGGHLPIHGLRHPPEGDTCGWYIWAGDPSAAEDFFQALHAEHLAETAPEVLPYLGLGPGWRFLVAPGYEDVWFDPNLLRV